jgi:protein-L-isoaspartate(D-aspartate) O-methyltransferase
MNEPGTSPYEAKRRDMVENQLRARGIYDPRVLDAMFRIPRHEFVPLESRALAYEDHPIPIAEEQTISQPFIIAVSLQALAFDGSESVLEVGTGSGYQSALLCLLAKRVYSVERHPSLAKAAAATLAQLSLNNVNVMVGDGSQGWPAFAPFQTILVSAAAPTVPASLVQQLSDGGRMVIPVGPPYAQELRLIRKSGERTIAETVEGCRFVPLIGAEGY